MKITKIEISGFHNVNEQKWEFENINYFKGPNGIGKTTVLQAIQLALLGYIPGTAKKPGSIFKHASDPRMSVSLYIQDDESNQIKITRTFSNSSSTIEVDPPTLTENIIEEIVPDIELPIFNFTEFMGMTANKMKDWFINFLPNAQVDIDYRKEFADNLSKNDIYLSDSSLVDDCMKHIDGIAESGLEKIRKVHEYIKILISDKKAEVSRHESTIQSLVYYEDIDTNMYDKDKLSSELTHIDEIISKKKGYEQFLKYKAEACSDSYSDLAEDISKDVNYQTLTNNLEELVSEQNTLQEHMISMAGKTNELKAEKAELERVAFNEDVCPYTSKLCSEIASISQNANEKISKINDDLEVLYIENSTTEDKLAELKSLVESRRMKIQNIMNRYRERDKMQQELTVHDDGSDEAIQDTRTIEELEDIRKDISDKIAKLNANEYYDNIYDKIVAAKYMAESELDALKSWEKLTGVNGLQTSDKVNGPFIELKYEMDKYIPIFFGNNSETKFDLIGKANSFSVGIERNNRYIPFNMLSSGEKCMFAVSLMIAITRLSHSPLKLVMIDDMFDHLDDTNIQVVFECISKCKDIQMIFAGVKDVNADINCIELKK